MIFCLGDDLTGTTEVACQAAASGIPGKVWTDAKTCQAFPALSESDLSNHTPEVQFINLGCRTFTNLEARIHMIRCFQHLDLDGIGHLYLKVDSAGRGPIRGLLEGLLITFGVEQIPFLLANPGQSRTVQGGTIFVGDQPLHKSVFVKDPLHPTRESSVLNLLQGIEMCAIQLEGTATSTAGATVICLDCMTAEDVRRQAERWSRTRLAVGAAPFGVELLHHWLNVQPELSRDQARLDFSQTLAVIGTLNPAGDSLEESFRQRGGTVISFADTTDVQLPLLLRSPKILNDPANILGNLTHMAQALIQNLKPVNLFVAGGETSQSLVGALGIEHLEPLSFTHQIAFLKIPYQANCSLQSLLLTPGSYASESVWKKLFSS